MRHLIPQDLRLTLFQANLAWEDPVTNRAALGRDLEQLAGKTDVVLLPEMFATGFSMATDRLAEAPDGPSVTWMAKQAERLDTVVAGSLIIQEEEHCYNRLIWMRPNGTWDHYDKRHLFIYAGEDESFHAGSKRLITTWKGWRICPMVCYDLRFPVWSRNTEAYDLLIYVANWPARRANAWRTLLPARAIENMAWVAAVNRVGEDGNSIAYSGHSGVWDPLGEKQWEQADVPAVHTITLAGNAVGTARDKFRFLDDQDAFHLAD